MGVLRICMVSDKKPESMKKIKEKAGNIIFLALKCHSFTAAESTFFRSGTRHRKNTEYFPEFFCFFRKTAVYCFENENIQSGDENMVCCKKISELLKNHHQEQLLRFWNQLSDASQKQLLGQLEELDFDKLDALIREYVLRKPEIRIPDDLGPAPYFPLTPRNEEQAEKYRKAAELGVRLLRERKVSCLTVAGGQGTRLGFDGPKGTYPIAPVSGKTLFQYFAESIRRAGAKFGGPITWYIMTSLLNREATEKFFHEHAFFGLDPRQVVFFSQGTMPAIDYQGKLFLGEKDSLSLSPDGHGGTLLALRKSGALDRMKQEKVEYLSYFQVDNPLIPVVNPLFIGLHAMENSQMSAVMLAKTGPFEKLGNFCVSNGHLQIIEYSDLPKELAESRNADGGLKFISGSPAIHVISRDFIEHLTSGGSLNLPWHRADKKIPYIDENGNQVKPETPNGVKLESFIFDALTLADRTMVLECDRNEVFAPTKNPTGVDSVESCRAMLVERDAKRLAAAGVEIPRRADGSVDALIELSPLEVFDEEDAKAYVKKHHLAKIERGSKVYLQ